MTMTRVVCGIIDWCTARLWDFAALLRHRATVLPAWIVERRSSLLVVVPALIVLATIILVALNLPDPVTMASASVHAETLEFVVDNDRSAGVSLPKARYSATGSFGDEGGQARRPPCLQSVEISPESGAQVEYTRPIGGPLTIRVLGDSSWRSVGAKRAAPAVDGVAYFRVDDACAAGAAIRLPISGTLTIGEAGGVALPNRTKPVTPAYPILDGSLNVYGRSIGDLVIFRHWHVPITSIPGTVSQKFYLADTIALPVGSRLIEIPGCNADASYVPPRWQGFADTVFTPDHAFDRGLLVQVATDAPELSLLAPAAPTNCPDQISLTLGARLTSDPNLRWLFSLGSGALVVLGIVMALVTFWQTEARNG